MGKFDNFSTKAVYAASLITSILCMGLWVLTTNVFVLICAMVIVPFCVTRIFHRQVTGRGKVFVTLILILLFAVCMLWFRNKPQVDNTPTDTPGIVDTTPADNTDENKDDNPVIDDQKVNTGSNAPGKFYGYGKAKPKADEVITPEYSNTGGSSKNGQTVNKGKVTTDGTDSVKIEVPSTDPEGDKALQKDKDAGKDIHKTDSGITWTADNTPDDKKDDTSNKKDESPKIDVSKENAVKLEPSKESDKKPTTSEPKQDATKTDNKKLDDLYNSTSKTESGPAEGKGDKKPATDEVKNTATDSKADKPNTTTEEKKPQSGADQTTTNSQKGEQQGAMNNDSDKKAETKPEVETTPVTIVSLDGGKAYAGDSIQFRITGEVKSIEGLDGYVKGVDYTFTNGCLTINTHPKVATNITVEVVGTNGTTATSTVAISVI